MSRAPKPSRPRPRRTNIRKLYAVPRIRKGSKRVALISYRGAIPKWKDTRGTATAQVCHNGRAYGTNKCLTIPFGVCSVSVSVRYGGVCTVAFVIASNTEQIPNRGGQEIVGRATSNLTATIRILVLEAYSSSFARITFDGDYHV